MDTQRPFKASKPLTPDEQLRERARSQDPLTRKRARMELALRGKGKKP